MAVQCGSVVHVPHIVVSGEQCVVVVGSNYTSDDSTRPCLAYQTLLQLKSTFTPLKSPIYSLNTSNKPPRHVTICYMYNWGI